MVSVLEGGYRIQGGIVSAFARSVAGHVRALVDGCESRQVSVVDHLLIPSSSPWTVVMMLRLLLLLGYYFCVCGEMK